jgi:hypothetical protein
MLNKNPKYADALNDKGWAFIFTNQVVDNTIDSINTTTNKVF